MKQVKKLNLSTIRKVFSLMGKFEKIVFIVLITAALISAWLSASTVYQNNTTPAPDHGGVFREGMVGQPRLINPVLATSSVDSALVKLVYSGLYKYDETGQLVPDLAESMPAISEDQKEYTVKIKSGSRFHNDREVTADDILFTVETIQNPSFKSPLRSEWLNTTVEKISDMEVRFKNSSISAPFLHTLTLPILPKRFWGNVEPDNFQLSELNLKAIGSGPYKVREITKLPSGDIQKIIFESFKDYTGGEPFIERIIVIFYTNLDDAGAAFQSGEISGLAWTPYTQISDANILPKKELINQIPLPEFQALFFNLNNSKFKNPLIRKILAQATPKQEIVNTTLEGFAKILNSPIIPGQIGYKDIETLDYNLEEAKASWAEQREKPEEITIITNDSTKNVGAAEIIARSWEQLGVKVNIQTSSTKELSEKFIRTREFEVLLFGQKAAADTDPFAFWHSSQIKDPGLNVSGFANAEVDQLLTGARSTLNYETRKANYEKFLDIMNDEMPAIFLNQGVLAYAIKSEIKKPEINVLFDASMRFSTISKWYIDERRVWK